METSIWEIAWGRQTAAGFREKHRMLFSSRSLLMQSIALSHSTLPNVKIHDHGTTVLVEYTDKDDSGVYQTWFAVNQIVKDEHVYNDVEHL